MDITEIEQRIKRALDKKRYEHSLGVANEAREMALRLGADEDKAYLAGLLHDCAKCMSMEEYKALSLKYNVELDDITLNCPPVIHAPIGAAVAEYEYNITDSEILDAIRYHTVARENMTLLDKIIYLADMTEPGRDFDGVDEIRALAALDILNAYKRAVARSLIYNISKGKTVHPNTLYAWNELCK